MKTFTIENETNNIIVHTTIQEAEAVADAERFRNEAALAKLAANWLAARLVDIWNSLPGATPVKKFKDRAAAVSRIWKALQSLDDDAPVAEEAAPVAEAAPVSGQIEEVAAQPEAVIPESTEPAVAAPVAPHAPDVAPQEPGAPCVCPACGRALPKAKKERSAAARVRRAAGQDGPREDSKT